MKPGQTNLAATSSEVAVILLTKNSERYLRELLEAVQAQASRRPLEVIAIDSGSRDNTLNLLRQYPVQVLQIAPNEFNHGETRNLGARQASPSVSAAAV